MGLNFIGKNLVILGLFIALAGVILIFSGKITWLGRLPGDLYVSRKNYTFYFPAATSLILSIVISIVFFIFSGKR